MSPTPKRVSLAALGARAAGAPASPSVAAVPAPAPATPAQRTPTRPQRKPTPVARPRFDDYERKETRLAAEQLDQLAKRSRQLNRTRKREGERITENTLIRIAVDLLLSRPELAGKTEAELRKSVGL